MNVVVFASRKGGSGKSTLAAHLAAHVHKASRPCLLVDTDPQGSLTLWHGLRQSSEPLLKTATRNLAGLIKSVKDVGAEWVFIDTPPNMSSIVEEAIRVATLVVIPARPSIFDLTAVKDTIAMSRQARKPYAVIINGAPARREDVESPIVLQARETLTLARVPVWSGQITQRTAFSLALAEGEGAREYDADSLAAAEIGRLWNAIDKSIKAIHGSAAAGVPMHKAA